MVVLRGFLLAALLPMVLAEELPTADCGDMDLRRLVIEQGRIIKQLTERMDKQDSVIKQLDSSVRKLQGEKAAERLKQEMVNDVLVQNDTIEERVSLLETQVVEIEEDIGVLFDEQVIQDERLLNLETSDIQIIEQIETLEEDAEENQTETIAFNANLATIGVNISFGDPVIFDNVLLNEGTRYNNETGIFTVGSGNDGTYYFSTYLSVDYDEWAFFEIDVNNEAVCTAFGDHSNIESSEAAHTSCSAVVNVSEGDEIKVVFRDGHDDSPLNTGQFENGFNGFRL